MQTNNLLLQKEKEFMKNFILFTAPFHLFMGAFYYIVDPEGIGHLLIFLFFLCVLFGGTLGLKKNLSFKFLSTIYIFAYSILQYSFYLLYNSILIQALYYIPIFLLLNYHYNIKIMLLWSIYIVISFLSPFLISKYFNISHPLKLSKTEDLIQSISTFVTVLFCVCFNLYYIKIFHKIKEDEAIKSQNEDKKPSLMQTFTVKTTDINHENPDAPESVTSDKFEELYQKAISCLEEKKLWQDPNFSLNQFAEILCTNRTYLSRTLKEKGNTNFYNLLNSYRIKQVLDDFDRLEHKNFTIAFIYQKAGFAYQASFNRVFKQVTGCTATEYLQQEKYQV
ncbi:helix-turn-helix protein [Chryseobacterium sp. CBTAP 102]|nr:helix-turn-helix protein [Chryseobacterium sp. CBTAP 102]